MKSTIIFTFHGLQNDRLKNDLPRSASEARYTVSSEKLEFLLDHITEKSCIPVSGINGFDSGHRIIITFDDGLLSDYEIAFPILKTYGIKATFFITVENIGKPGYVQVKQLKEMAANGMDIASHGMRHAYLVDMEKKDAMREIIESKNRLEQIIGASIKSYAPVGGHYHRWMIEIARETGYYHFATMIPGITYPNNNFNILRRNHIQNTHDLSYLLKLIKGDGKLLRKNFGKYYLLYMPKIILGLKNYNKIKNIIIRN